MCHGACHGFDVHGRDRDHDRLDRHAGSVGYIPMAMTDYLEQARAAQCTLLRRTETAGAGQDDVTAPAFLAWDKQDQAGRCLDAVLAMPAVLTSQALRTTSRDAPRPLHSFLAGIRTMVPPVEADRLLGPELGKLADRFTAHVTTIEDA